MAKETASQAEMIIAKSLDVIRSRHRSPNYPFISLGKAVERAKQIYDVERRHEVPVRVACEKRWEYKPGSSQGDQIVAALRAFGLLEITGAGDKRMLRISDRAYRILAGAQDAAERIKDAALAPAIHGELWQKYGTNGLPSDDVIRNYLVFERDGGRFNEDVVDSFIARFRETISFAKLVSSDKLDADGVNNGLRPGDIVQWFVDGEFKLPAARRIISIDGDSAYVEGYMMPIPVSELRAERQHAALSSPAKPAGKPLVPAFGQKDFPLYLSNNQRAVLYIPATISAKDFELLKKQIENHLAVIEATAISDE